MTEGELQTLTVYESELGAHLTENLLGNESFIDRLVGKETKLAEKVLNKIADLKKMFERIGNAEARAEYKRIKKAEKLYLGAGYAYINRKIVASRRREEVDASEEIQYNRKKTPYVQWKSDALAWANSSRTKIGDMDIRIKRRAGIRRLTSLRGRFSILGISPLPYKRITERSSRTRKERETVRFIS